MNKLLVVLMMFPLLGVAQVGIGTTTPEGQLDVKSDTMGLVVPRVTSIEDVTDGNGNLAVNGTVVYDVSRDKVCYRVADSWICIGKDNDGNAVIGTETPNLSIISNYIKASNTDTDDYFGQKVCISDDGTRLVVSANGEDSNTTGINGDQSSNSASRAGAVYVFRKNGSTWVQEAYIKASNNEDHDFFGQSISLNSDGSIMAIGSFQEDSNSTGINGNESDNSASNSGAVYVFTRTDTTWSQEAYIKASNTDAGDYFGYNLDLSQDGERLAVGAYLEDSSATGVGGSESSNGSSESGAVYIFTRNAGAWAQEAYIKASNNNTSDYFGYAIALDADATRLVVGAHREDANTTGINGNESNNSASHAGAVYVFSRSGTTWTQEAYIKPSNTDSEDYFGYRVNFDGDASRLVVGAYQENSNATGVNGNDADNSISDSGAAYVFKRNGTTWTQEAYIKASNTDSNDRFGWAISLNSDGNRLAIGAHWEGSNALNINSDGTDNSATRAGAVYVFSRNGTTWQQKTYVKASNTEANDWFGYSLSFTANGAVLVVSAQNEASNATGIGGNQANNSKNDAGAVYVIE